MLLSSVLQKAVVFDGQIVGKLDGICWQKGKACLLLIKDKFFCADKIVAKDDLLATNLQQVELPSPPLTLGKSAYTTCGKFLGQIADVELTATLKLKCLLLDNDSTITLSQIVGNNDILTVRENKPKKQVAPTAVPKTTELSSGKSSQRDNVVSANLTTQDITKLDDGPTDKQVKIATSSPTETHDVGSQNNLALNVAPKRKSGDFSFLVGKVVDKNIFNFLGELMIREGDVVTRSIYIKARMYGKLTELCLHTK